MMVVTAIDGFGFVKNITTVQTGYPTNIGIEVRNGSSVNVSINYGDGSEPMWIVNIDDVLDIFVITLWHISTSLSDPFLFFLHEPSRRTRHGLKLSQNEVLHVGGIYTNVGEKVFKVSL